MSLSVSERNIKAKDYVLDLYKKIESKEEGFFSSHPLFHHANNLLEDLIAIKAQGFRGIVLTALVGKNLDPLYDFLEDFYACNPRSIFEKGIYIALRELSIPSGKSDPLNVAKNIQKIDTAWAKGKRPETAAMAVVNFLQLLEDNFANQHNYQFLAELFMFRLKEYADKVNAIEIEEVIVTNDLQQELATKLWQFISTAIEGGTTPQFVIGILLEALHLYDIAIKVEGTRESVSGTNTTSNKPGDLIIKRDGQISQIYEVTLKIVDEKRLHDSLDVLRQLDVLNIPITFLCRIPQDISSLDIKKLNRSNAFIKSPHLFNFVDIESFIYSIFSLLDATQLQYIFDCLQNFIDTFDRPPSTKEAWNKIFA